MPIPKKKKVLETLFLVEHAGFDTIICKLDLLGSIIVHSLHEYLEFLLQKEV